MFYFNGSPNCASLSQVVGLCKGEKILGVAQLHPKLRGSENRSFPRVRFGGVMTDAGSWRDTGALPPEEFDSTQNPPSPVSHPIKPNKTQPLHPHSQQDHIPTDNDEPTEPPNHHLFGEDSAFIAINKAANKPTALPDRAHPPSSQGAGCARRWRGTAQLQADKAVSHVIHNVDFMLAVTTYERAAEVLHLIRNQQCLCL